MSLVIAAEIVPLATDSEGVVRIGRSRVTLDTLVSAFREGATAEEISQQYPSLDLGDIYSVIGYYLRRREEVDAHVQDRQRAAADLRRQNEAIFDPRGVRDRLLARQARRG